MTLIKLPDNAGFALRNAPPEQQRAFLAAIENWPSNVGQSLKSFSAQRREKIEQIVKVWGGVWLNPEGGNQKLEFQCAHGHFISTKTFYLRQGVWCAGCYVDSLRDSIESMQQLAAKHNGKCLSTEYINSYSKISWQCEQGHIWEVKPDWIKLGHWCPVCDRLKKRAQVFAEINAIAQAKGGKCLSKEHISHKTKLKFRCGEGHIWETASQNIQGGYWCPECRYDKILRSLKELQEIAAGRGGKCLAKKFTTMNDKVSWQCEQGHIWEARPSKVKEGSWCKLCVDNSRRLTLKEMQLLAVSRGGKCLSTEYINSWTKLRWQCSLGHVWSATSGHVKNGTWCPECYYLSLCLSDKARQKYLPTKE